MERNKSCKWKNCLGIYIQGNRKKNQCERGIVCLKVNVSKWVKLLFTQGYADRKDLHIWNWFFIGQGMKNLGLNTVSFYGNNLAGVQLLSCLVMSLPTVTQQYTAYFFFLEIVTPCKYTFNGKGIVSTEHIQLNKFQ